MKSLFTRDRRRRSFFDYYEEKRLFYRYIIRNDQSPIDKKIEASLCLQELPRDYSLTRIRNRCLLTGRGRGTFSRYGVSRIRFRELLQQGLLPGFIKSVW